MNEMFQPKIVSEVVKHTRPISTLCFSPTQRILCSAGGSKKCILTNLETYQAEKVFEGHSIDILGSSKQSCFSFDGNLLATSSYQVVRIWNVEKGTKPVELKGHSMWVFGCQFFHKDSTKVVSGGQDLKINVYDIPTEKTISTFTESGGIIWSVDVLHDNNTIVSGDGNGEIRIFDLRTERCEKVLKSLASVRSVRFHSNSNKLGTGSDNGWIELFDLRKDFESVHKFEEHSSHVRTVDFHPFGKYLVSGSFDESIKIFNLEERKVLFTLKDHKSYVACVRFSPDGQHFASGGWDKKVFLWTFPPGKKCRKDPDEDERVEYLVESELINAPKSSTCKVLEISLLFRTSLYGFKVFFL